MMKKTSGEISKREKSTTEKGENKQQRNDK